MVFPGNTSQFPRAAPYIVVPCDKCAGQHRRALPPGAEPAPIPITEAKAKKAAAAAAATSSGGRAKRTATKPAAKKQPSKRSKPSEDSRGSDDGDADESGSWDVPRAPPPTAAANVAAVPLRHDQSNLDSAFTMDREAELELGDHPMLPDTDYERQFPSLSSSFLGSSVFAEFDHAPLFAARHSPPVPVTDTPASRVLPPLSLPPLVPAAASLPAHLAAAKHVQAPVHAEPARMRIIIDDEDE
jgi:hypothetical protein